jgi:hypothetical protein
MAAVPQSADLSTAKAARRAALKAAINQIERDFPAWFIKRRLQTVEGFTKQVKKPAHAKLIKIIAAKYARSTENREEIRQCILLSLWSKRSSYDHSRGATITTWLHMIATHTAIDWHRSNVQRQPRLVNVDPDQLDNYEDKGHREQPKPDLTFYDEDESALHSWLDHAIASSPRAGTYHKRIALEQWPRPAQITTRQYVFTARATMPTSVAANWSWKILPRTTAIDARTPDLSIGNFDESDPIELLMAQEQVSERLTKLEQSEATKRGKRIARKKIERLLFGKEISK